MKRSVLIKAAIAIGALALFAFLFMRSLEDARTTPYTIDAQHLRSWTLALEPAQDPTDPMLVLRAAPELASGLFRQVFSRAMESLSASAVPAIPLVLRGEFDRTLSGRSAPDALLAEARTAGLESAAIAPRCMVHRRVSEPGGTRQVFFVLFDAPAIPQFRRQLGLDPEALSPILFVAGSGADFSIWLPQRVDAERDCLAPVEIAD